MIAFMSACTSLDTSRTSSRNRTYNPDEHDVRMAICIDQIRPEPGETWFLDESSAFIEELKKKSGVGFIRHISLSRYDQLKDRPVDRYTGMTGFDFAILNVEISSDSATALVNSYSSSLGSTEKIVTLRKANGHWKIVERKLVGVS